MLGRTTVMGRYAVVAIAGALCGGLFVARLTNIIPRLLSTMMETMYARMATAGVNPAEM